MQTQTQIAEYITKRYAGFEQETIEYFAEILFKSQNANRSLHFKNAYINVGSIISDTNGDHDNIMVATFQNTDEIHLDDFRKDLLENLLEYQGDGIDNFNFMYSYDTVIITFDLSY